MVTLAKGFSDSLKPSYTNCCPVDGLQPFNSPSIIIVYKNRMQTVPAVQLKPHLMLQISVRIKIKLLSLRTCVHVCRWAFHRLAGKLKLTVNTQRALIFSSPHGAGRVLGVTRVQPPIIHPPQSISQDKWNEARFLMEIPVPVPGHAQVFIGLTLLSLQCWYSLFFRLVFLFVAGIFITVVLPCNFDSRRRHKMTEYQNRGATNSVCRPGNVSTRLVKISFGWALWGGGACFCHRCLCLSFVLS